MRKVGTLAQGRNAIGGFVALGCVGFVASAPAMAQDASQPTLLQGVTVTDTAVEEGYGAREVSSPKATAPILDTPRIVNVINEQVLEDSAIFSLEDAFRTVPGITLGSGEGGNANGDIPLIRGVEASADMFVDGVRDTGSQSREVFALEQIEVSKGPSSAFGGRGTAAGAINLVSKVARQGNFANAQVTAGTDDLVRVVGDVNAQLSDELSVRVVGMYHDSMVPGRNEVFDDRWGVSPSITYKPNDALRLTLDYYHLETDTMPDFGIPFTSTGQRPDGTRRPAEVDRNNFYGLLSRDFQKTNADAATMQVEAALATGLVLSNTTRFTSTSNRYIVTNPDDSAGNVANGYVWRNTKSRGSVQDGIGSNTNLAAVFETGSISHSVSLGVEYSQSDSTNQAYTVAAGSHRVSNGTGCTAADLPTYNCTTLADPNPRDPWNGSITRSPTITHAKAEDVSLYLFDTIALSSKLLLNGGVRWTDYSASSVSGTTVLGHDSDFWSYQGGVVFKPTESMSLYVSYANSKTPPGTSVNEGSENLTNVNKLYEPTTNENWEIGAKAEVFGGDLLLSGALFRADRKNIQNRVDDIVTDVFNAARIQGVEVSATGMAGPVSLMVGYTYLDSELQDSSANDGNRLPQTAKHNLSATANWQITPRFSVGGGAYAVSRRYADAANLISAGGYTRFDLNAAFEINDHLGLRVNVNNVTDERYMVKLRNPHFAVPADGRQALVTLTARY